MEKMRNLSFGDGAVCHFGGVTPAVAATTSQDGLEVTLTTDKESYSQGEQIEATLTVTNTNDAAVTNVSLENLVPDGYALAEDSAATKTVESLEAGESVSLATDYVQAVSDQNGNGLDNGNTANQNGNGSGNGNTAIQTASQNNSGNAQGTSTNQQATSGKTGDYTYAGIWVAVVVAAAACLLIVAVVKKKQGKKLLSLVLCVATAGTVSVCMSANTEAAETDAMSISISENLKIDNTDCTISAIVEYDEIAEQEQSVDEYYDENSEVIEVIPVEESEDVLTEEEANAVLQERGFTDYPVTYYYSLQGEYDDEAEASEESEVKHPMYQTYYLAENGDVWAIFIINNQIFANPASFNLDSDLEARVMISETETITSYDSQTNQYFVTIPKKSALIVDVVDQINAETLDKLTGEVLEKL